jgi:hypothetical protein
MKTLSFSRATDDHLVAEVPRLAIRERGAGADFVACLAEFDARKLYLGLGFGSIYSYCAAKLHLTEGPAYRRIESARATRKAPVVLEMLRDGRLSLATTALIGPKLTPENADRLLKEVAFRSKREVELILAKRNPKPPLPSVLRKLPEPKAATAPVDAEDDAPAISLSELVAAPAPRSHRPHVAPLSDAHYKLQVTISSAARERLQQIQDLMRHRLPTGDPAVIVEHALEVLHADLLKKKAAEVARPRPGRFSKDAKGRYIPASVKRAVFRRDRGACAFVSESGTTCGSTSSVEFHHVHPYSVGGDASVENIQLRCRAHNGFEWARHVDEESASLAQAAETQG